MNISGKEMAFGWMALSLDGVEDSVTLENIDGVGFFLTVFRLKVRGDTHSMSSDMVKRVVQSKELQIISYVICIHDLYSMISLSNHCLYPVSRKRHIIKISSSITYRVHTHLCACTYIADNQKSRLLYLSSTLFGEYIFLSFDPRSVEIVSWFVGREVW